jgi:cytochrome b
MWTVAMNSTEASGARSPAIGTLQVWDLPVRVFHWSLVVLVTLSWASAENGYMRVHVWSGLTLLTLLLFRVAWGFFGSTTARFSDFVRGPRQAVAYLHAIAHGDDPEHLGHNPAGGWMVLMLLAVLLAQAITGLFANDGVRFNAPLSGLVSSVASDRLTQLHGTIFNYILLLVWMHVVAVMYYRFVRGENLVAAMITGMRPIDGSATRQGLRFLRLRWALLWLAIAAAAVWWIARVPS